MRKNYLRKEMAAAVLALGIGGAVPAYAQQDNVDVGDNITISSSISIPEVNSINDIPVDTALLFLLSLAVIGYAGYKRSDGNTYKAGALAIAFAAILNPQKVTQDFRELPTIIPVFVDRTESIGNRAPLVTETFEKLEEQLSAQGFVDVRLIEFSGEQNRTLGDGTRLRSTLSNTLREIPADQLGASFIISDGNIHDIDSTIPNIPNISSEPIHALIVGHDQEQDFFIRIEEAPNIGFLDEDQSFAFRVVDARNPDSNDMTALVDISYNGSSTIQKEVTLNELQTIKVSELSSEGLEIGNNQIEVFIRDINGGRASSMDFNGDGEVDEVTLVNNRASISIEGVDSDIRVLLLSGAPHQGTNLWRDTLLDNPNVTLTHISYLRPLAKIDATPYRDFSSISVPVEEIFEEKLPEFDIVIMDNYSFNGIIPAKYLNKIKDYTFEGGAFVVTGAESLTEPTSVANLELGDMLPFNFGTQTIDGPFTLEVTKEGLLHPLGRILQNAYNGDQWGPWYSIASSSASIDATVIASDGTNNPLLAIREYGEGRIAVLTSDQAYLWNNNHQNGGPAKILYRSLIGWSAGDSKYDPEQLNLARQDDEIIIDLQTMEDQPGTIIVTTPSGKTFEIEPTLQDNGIFTARFQANEYGTYSAQRAQDNTKTAFIIADFEDQREIFDVISDTQIVEQLTQETGGLTARVTDINYSVSLPPIDAVTKPETTDNVMLVNMKDKQEPVSQKSEPYIPMPVYLLAFGLLLLCSFKPKNQKLIPWTKSLFVSKTKHSPEP